MTHTERVHVIFGVVVAVTGALALWSTARPRSPARLVWPVLAFLMGFFLFIPVEAQTRTYQELGWWATLRSVIPSDPGHWLRDWLRYVDEWHVIQHKLGSLCIMAVGVIEWARARGRLGARAWGAALPLLLLGTGLAFGLHGGTEGHLLHRTEQWHHHFAGVLLTLAAVALLVARARRLRHPAWAALWAALVLVVGLDIALFYRLTPEERATGGHRHESVGPGMR